MLAFGHGAQSWSSSERDEGTRRAGGSGCGSLSSAHGSGSRPPPLEPGKATFGKERLHSAESDAIHDRTDQWG